MTNDPAMTKERTEPLRASRYLCLWSLVGHWSFRRVPLFHPYLVERRVLHALAVLHEVAVCGVDGAVLALDHHRVVERPLVLFLQVPRPLPRLPLVVGQAHRQAVPP